MAKGRDAADIIATRNVFISSNPMIDCIQEVSFLPDIMKVIYTSLHYINDFSFSRFKLEFIVVFFSMVSTLIGRMLLASFILF